MAVNYVCRHCRTPLGSLDRDDLSEAALGFHFLTPEERGDIITYDAAGNVTVRVICDYCREALEANPELLLIESPLQ